MVKEAAEKGTLAKLNNEQLKQYLKAQNVNAKGNKQALVAMINDLLGI